MENYENRHDFASAQAVLAITLRQPIAEQLAHMPEWFKNDQRNHRQSTRGLLD